MPRLLGNKNTTFGKHTIMWDDIAHKYPDDDEYGFPVSLEAYLNCGVVDDDDNPLYDLSFFGRSILKLQGLGVLQTDFKTTMGTSSINNLDRIHITLTGQEILKYINKIPRSE